MTIKETVERRLVANGMFEGQAREAMDAIVVDPELDDIMSGGRWHDQAECYPTVFLAALWLRIKPKVLDWIDTNCPRAWFRPCFAEEPKGGGR
jgi:hypothetical protein